mmetsp:Transcript_19305/g.28531  ORF Transcript_19305/g.28531 Transcript_19305/m.28531 type:complete len:216 (+) Transcript_19305:79-726(+)
MNILRRRKTDLPGSYRKQSPQFRELPKITPLKILGVSWVLVSLGLFVFGLYNCQSSSESIRLRCTKDVCGYSSKAGGNVIEDAAFLRENFVSADLVKIVGGKILESPVSSRKKRKSSSSSYAIKWKDSRFGIVQKPMSHRSLGRNIPRQKVQEIMSYIRKETDEIEIEHTKWTSGIGLVCVIFGIMLFMMRMVVGNLSDSVDSSHSDAPIFWRNG